MTLISIFPAAFSHLEMVSERSKTLGQFGLLLALGIAVLLAVLFHKGRA